MRNRRTILWLLAALCLTAAAHVLLSYKGDAGKALVQRTALMDAPAATVSRVEIRRAGERGAELVRAGAWRLVKPYASYVDERAVMKLLDALATGEVEASIGEQELLRLGHTRSDYGLSAPRVTVSISGTSGDGVVSFGAATASGDGIYAAERRGVGVRRLVQRLRGC